MKKLALFFFTFLLALFSFPCFGEGYGNTEYNAFGNAILKAGVQKDNTVNNYITVGRYWNGTHYRAFIGSYLKSTGGQDFNFAMGTATESRLLLDLGGLSLDNLCTGIVYANGGFITACRAMQSNGYYDTYLVKFDNSGTLDATFGTNGIKKTGLGGNATLGNAYVRGIIYDPNTGNSGHNGTVVVAGSIGKTSPGVFHPFIAAFDQQDGSQYGSTTTLSGINGTAVGIAFDSGNSKYYTASTETSANRNFYVHQFNTSLTASASPWGTAVNFSSAISGGAADSVPSGIAIIGTNVITVGGNRATTSSPWRCAVTAHVLATGNLNTSFGTVNSPLTGGTSNQGITLFTSNTSYSCLLNGITAPPSGTTISTIGSNYNASNYDYLAAQMNSSGTMNGSFGTNGIYTQDEPTHSDDVHSAMIWIDGSTTNFYGIGRSLSNTAVNGTALSQIATDTGTFVTATPNVWTTITTTSAPTIRAYHSAVWTGSKMIVFGGLSGSTRNNTGALYDPVANSWTATTTTGAPARRYSHTATWAGTKMIVFGGYTGSAYLNSGASYDPVNNSWNTISTIGAPSVRAYYTSVWNGSKMLIFGGDDGSALNTGGIYDPSSNSWTTITTTGAPSKRAYHSALWTGSKMLVWAGINNNSENNTGGSYSPTDNSWTSLATTNAPGKRNSHIAVWTGFKMLVFGGQNGGVINTGGIYDPANDTWTSIPTTGAPSRRYLSGGVWTGSEMLVWAGSTTAGTYYNTGGRYNPVANSWSNMTSASSPSIRESQTAVWTGAKMIVFGGTNGSALNTGGVYTP